MAKRKRQEKGDASGRPCAHQHGYLCNNCRRAQQNEFLGYCDAVIQAWRSTDDDQLQMEDKTLARMYGALFSIFLGIDGGSEAAGPYVLSQARTAGRVNADLAGELHEHWNRHIGQVMAAAKGARKGRGKDGHHG